MPRSKGIVIGFWIGTALFCLQIGFTAYAQLRLPQVAEGPTRRAGGLHSRSGHLPYGKRPEDFNAQQMESAGPSFPGTACAIARLRHPPCDRVWLESRIGHALSTALTDVRITPVESTSCCPLSGIWVTSAASESSREARQIRSASTTPPSGKSPTAFGGASAAAGESWKFSDGMRPSAHARPFPPH